MLNVPDIVEPESFAFCKPEPLDAAKFKDAVTAAFPCVPAPPLVELFILSVGAANGAFLINVILSSDNPVVAVLKLVFV